MKKTPSASHSIKRKVIKTILGIFSLSTMLFVFQACYGTPQDFGQDVLVEGTVKSNQHPDGIEGIGVHFKNFPQYTETAADGSFSIYCGVADSYTLTFSDVDDEVNGQYSNKDTVITRQAEQYSLHFNISLD